MDGELLIVTGPPGSGKSMVAMGLSELRAPSVLVEGDEFFRFLRAGRVEPWLVESHKQNEIAIDAAAAATGRFALGGFWTVYDGVVGPWFLPRFLRASGMGQAHYVVLLPPVETCVERVAHRVGHGFTDEPATRHMHARFEQADVAERYILRDTVTTPSELVSAITGLMASGQLVHCG